jgi:hypothetical protein
MIKRKFLLVGSWILCMVLCGCVPVQPSEQQLVGKWRVTWSCGTEEVELKADSSYMHEIDFAVGGHASHAGTWKVTPKESHLEGAHVVLQDAMEFCSVFGEKLPQPERGDRRLQTVWEWGRMILEFNPDWQGFERQ